MAMEETEAATTHPIHESIRNDITSDDRFMREIGRNIQLLATSVATATYAAGFNTPGGVWQDTDGAAAGHLPGDPIIRSTDYQRYLVFFYCNATAFALSLMVFVLVLLLTARRRKNDKLIGMIFPRLREIVLLDLLSLIGAYAAGTCQDTFTAVFYSLLVAVVFTYVVVHKVLALASRRAGSDGLVGIVFRKILMLLATFVLAAAYLAGLSTPGGFWDSTEGGHRPGDAILKDHHHVRHAVFFVCNTTAFVASLLIIAVVLTWKLRWRLTVWCSIVALIGLVGAYAAGSCRETNTTVYMGSLVGAILAYNAFHVAVARYITHATTLTCFWRKFRYFLASVSGWLQIFDGSRVEDRKNPDQPNQAMRIRQTYSLVQLLATLAVTITYQAGIDPPGGLWPDNGDGHMAGDPILLTTNGRRYKAFFYCNSVAFVASLITIILVQRRHSLEHYELQASTLLELLSLIGAYAMGSCRDSSTSVYVMGLAGAAVVYVVLHLSYYTRDSSTGSDSIEDDALVGKMSRRLLLFAIMVATVTYQAGLTPPGGFLLQGDESGHHAGDPVLLCNFPRRYKAYFYFNSVSLMLSIAQILVLVNPVLYKPAIRSHALSVCTAVSFICLMGAFAAGSTLYVTTSIYIFVLLCFVFLPVVLLLLLFLVRTKTNTGTTNDGESRLEQADTTEDVQIIKAVRARWMDLMTLGILVASVTYQAGLDPPGGSWQDNSDGHDAGNPVMHDNRRHRYLAFFYSNSMSFVASIFLIISLLPTWLQVQQKKWHFSVKNAMVVLEFLGLLVAYTAGSSRQWKESVYVVAVVIAVLAYVAIRVAIRAMRLLFRMEHQQANSPEQIAPV